MKWRWTSQLRMQMNVWTADVILVPLETVWEHATSLHAVKSIYHTLLTWVVQLLCLWVFCESHHVSSSSYRKAEVLPKPRRHWDDSTPRPTDRLDLRCRRCLYMKAKASPVGTTAWVVMLPIGILLYTASWNKQLVVGCRRKKQLLSIQVSRLRGETAFETWVSCKPQKSRLVFMGLRFHSICNGRFFHIWHTDRYEMTVILKLSRAHDHS